GGLGGLHAGLRSFHVVGRAAGLELGQLVLCVGQGGGCHVYFGLGDGNLQGVRSLERRIEVVDGIVIGLLRLGDGVVLSGLVGLEGQLELGLLVGAHLPIAVGVVHGRLIRVGGIGVVLGLSVLIALPVEVGRPKVVGVLLDGGADGRQLGVGLSRVEC